MLSVLSIFKSSYIVFLNVKSLWFTAHVNYYTTVSVSIITSKILFYIAYRFRHGEFLKTIPTSFEKLQELYFLEDNMWFHSIDIPLQHPEMLEFSQFVTRTKLIPWIPESYDCNPILSSYLKYLFSEELHSVNSKPVNIHDQSIDGLNLRADYRRKKISMIMETVYRAFLSARTESLVNELSTQIDERATIEIFLKRLVDHEVFENSENVNEDVYEPVNETIIDVERCVHYRIRSELAWQLRGPFPLKPVSKHNFT